MGGTNEFAKTPSSHVVEAGLYGALVVAAIPLVLGVSKKKQQISGLSIERFEMVIYYNIFVRKKNMARKQE